MECLQCSSFKRGSPMTHVQDSSGNALSGANNAVYQITVPAYLPYNTTTGWWSLIPYNDLDNLVATPINRWVLWLYKLNYKTAKMGF